MFFKKCKESVIAGMNLDKLAYDLTLAWMSKNSSAKTTDEFLVEFKTLQQKMLENIMNDSDLASDLLEELRFTAPC